MTELKRSLGVGTLAFYGLGTILGAGIYTVIGAAAGRAGESMWLAFALSAVIALITALSYAELATTFPRAGAEFVYLREALPRRREIAFVTGTMMVVSAAATTATVSVAFAGYLGDLVALPRWLVAPALLALVTGVAIVGIRESAWLTVVFTIIEAVGLVLVVFAAISVPEFGDALVAMPTAAILPAAALVFFSYLGFENIVNLAEEAKEPEKDLPRAIVAALVVASVLYIAVALATVALVPPAQLAGSEAPLVEATRTHAPWIARALGGIALFATANTALASILSGSRMLFGMSKARELPRAVGWVLPKRKTPWLATLLVSGLAAVLLPLRRVDVIASISSFASLVAFLAVNCAVVILRRRKPRLERPFRVPLAVGAWPILPLIGSVSIVVLATQIEPMALAYGAGLGVIALALHLVIRRRT